MTKKQLLQKLLMTALFTTLTAAGSLLRIGEASLQTMFACLAGILLGPMWGAASQALYVLLGLVGVPVFVYGGGISYVFQPFFGCLLGMILCAFVTGYLTERTNWSIWINSTLGLLSVYVIGTPYFYLIERFYIKANLDGEPISFAIALTASCLVFLMLDFGKLVICATVGKRLLPVVRKDLFE